jgi:hypothetical protein
MNSEQKIFSLRFCDEISIVGKCRRGTIKSPSTKKPDLRTLFKNKMESQIRPTSFSKKGIKTETTHRIRDHP